VPAALDAITRKLLAKNAEDRYQSARGLLADLEECRAQWRRAGRIEGLVPGQRDRSKRLEIPQKLYGREGDIRALTDAFERVLRGKREIVLVSGYSGTGKSSLVQEILRPLAREKGYYIHGKYDQNNREKPHSALIQAFEALIRQLLCESEERLARWRESIQLALGHNAKVICDILPSLELVIGAPDPVPALDPFESQNRFNLTFQRFVAVFARPAHPLALFLDDLQWIDSASLGLLKNLLADDEIESLFFCGAYRDNEVSPAHPFVRAAHELAQGGLGVRSIVLSPLDRLHLQLLLEDTLHSDDCGPLAEVVLAKTDGTPFFVKQFLKALHDRGHVWLDQAGEWRYDLAAVEAFPSMRSSVDLMLDTLRRLPQETLDTLKLASAIGERFDLHLLSAASEGSPDAVYARLAPAIEEGLVVRIHDRFRFAHDKIQEAATSMVPPEERALSHHRIGKLLRREPGDAAGPGLFDVVNHLNSSGDIVQDRAERVELSRLNLQAAERLEDAGAFQAALQYIEQGIARLPEDAWDTEHALALALHMKRGHIESLNGQYEPALATLSLALARATCRLDQTAVRRLRMKVHILKNDLRAAIDEGLAGLSAFDIHLPAFPSDEELTRELSRTFAELGDRSIASLAALPLLADPEIEALQNLLEELWVPCYLLNSNNFGITVMKILQSSMQHGVSKSTIHALLNFGTFLCTGRDIERGYAFGRAAVELYALHPNEQIEPMLCNMWSANIQHWKEPYAVAKETFLRGIHAGIERGQYTFAFYNLKNGTVSNLLRGLPLREMLVELSSYLPLCKLDAANAVTWMPKAIGQICYNLTHPTGAAHRIKGEWVDIEPIIAELRAAGNEALVLVADCFRIFLAVFQDACDEVADIAYAGDPGIPSVASWFGHPAYEFYGGMALSRACETASPETRARYVARIEHSLAKLERWVALFPGNLRHRALLLSAELARILGDTGAASTLYDEGIVAAREGGFLHDKALGNERCARHYLNLGKATIARAYMTEAYLLYARWGASEVTRRLERDHPTLLYRSELPRPHATGGASIPPAAHKLMPAGAELDLGAVLKASQALSGEIVRSRLLEKLMRILLENAGARRALLILKEEGRLSVEAEGDLGEGNVTAVRSTPLSSRADLLSNLVHYVARTGESVVIDDATAEPRYADEPYVKQRHPRSILAAPILHQGQIRGVIYLENALAAHAFTEGRVELLRLFASQIAISIENAQTYDLLEAKVKARTAELQAAHDEIMALSVAQQATIRTLSTPIIQVWDGVLAIPILGKLDGDRAAEIMESLLARISSSGARHALIDLTGVESVEAATADHLVRLVRAIELLGAQGIISGLHAKVARTMISLGLDMSGLKTCGTLRDALRMCMEPRAARRALAARSG
jgi:predicted ATPase/GAF domain-containing protein/anti-anti-sigma regulatory factor